MWKKLLLISGVVLLSSCSALDIAKEGAKAALGASHPALEARINAGKGEAEGDQSVAQNANTALSGQVNTTSDYGEVGQVVNESGLKLHELLLLVLLAGWAIPSPAEMLYGMVRATRKTYRIARGTEA
jgi:hypothetical protein